MARWVDGGGGEVGFLIPAEGGGGGGVEVFFLEEGFEGVEFAHEGSFEGMRGRGKVFVF